jgi:translocation and assembly module TamA
MSFLLSFNVSGSSVSFPYKVKVARVKKRGIRAELKAQSMCVRLQKSPPATIAQLRRRADADLTSMNAVLQSHGYYDGVVNYDINTNESPARVTFRTELNKRYIFRNMSIRYIGIASNAPVKIKILLKKNSPAIASAVAFEERRLLRQIKRKGYPFATPSDPVIKIDNENKCIDVDFIITPGPIATYGNTEVSGEKSIKPEYIYNRIDWKRGDLYNSKDVYDLEQDLLVSGLFNIAKVSNGKSLNSDGSLPMKIEVNERKHRTVRVGGSYRSDVGVGGIVSWEHRNLFHGAESLEYVLAISEIEQFQQVQFKLPDFLTRNLSLLIGVKSMREEPDAYSSRSYKGSTILEYKFTRYSLASIGTSYKYSFVEQFESGDDYDLFSIPVSYEIDTRDNHLDAQEGWRGVFLVEPFKDIRNDDDFIKVVTEDRGYILLSRKRSFVLAGRFAAGAISGAGYDGIPADERFYAGGGGSVRGYEYQTAGAVTTNGVPVGGLSFLEVSAEIRVRPGEKMGYVLFVDGGRAFSDRLANTNDPLLWGAGIGIRYNMGFAPLRVDFAIPLNKRGIDDDFQFYISIGQAF